MTYAESQGEQPFNWLAALKPGLTYEQLLTLKNLSGSWPTCACGNQCNVIPRWTIKDYDENDHNIYGQPKDPVLSGLGYSFNNYILHARDYAKDGELEKRDLYIEHARRIFLEIEQRAVELIKQINQ